MTRSCWAAVLGVLAALGAAPDAAAQYEPPPGYPPGPYLDGRVVP